MNKIINNLNELTPKTNRWLKVNEFNLGEVEIPELKEYSEYSIEKNDLNNIDAKIILDKSDKDFLNIENVLKNKIRNVDGVSVEIVDFIENNSNFNAVIVAEESEIVDENVYDEFKLKFKLNENNNFLVSKILIYAKKNSRLELIIDLVSDMDKYSIYNGLIKIYAEAGSKVKITKIQNLSSKNIFIDSVVSQIDSNASVKYLTVDIGSKVVASNYINFLNGENSHSEIKSIYMGANESKIDLKYNMIHEGVKSVSNIETKGVLNDSALKTFKGIIDFKNGAKKSIGKEDEQVILLSPDVISKTIPLLLCDEEDVQGNHSASSGRISQDKLYYLKSRGFSEKQAVKLIVEGSFNDILNEFKDEELKEKIIEEIEGRLK